MIKTDTLIVGGGPSGSMCGIRLRQAGKDCLIVDRAQFPRMKLCAGVLTGKSRSVLREVLGEQRLTELLTHTQMSHESHLRLWQGKNVLLTLISARRVVSLKNIVMKTGGLF